jgi:hypothetical protein
MSNLTIDRYIQLLMDDAARLRVPELLGAPHAAALYQVPNRGGVGVVALRTNSLSETQLSQLMSFRLAQYLLAGLIDPEVVYRERLRRDLTSSVSTRDIHVIAGVPQSGQILCYLVLRALASDATLRTQRRPLFPVEQAFGWGIYNDLPVLPDLSIATIVEVSRFVKNHQIDVLDEGLLRSPMEVVVGLHRLVCDPAYEIAAMVGDIDQTVGERYFGVFHMPTIMLRDLTPRTPEEGFLGWAARSRRFCPFATLVADLARQGQRLASIEHALALPGRQGVRSLLGLRRDALIPRSSLEVLPTQPSMRDQAATSRGSGS